MITTEGIDKITLSFGPSNLNYGSEYNYNGIFLKAQKDFLKNKFYYRGHMFLNEVYDELGFLRTPQGALCGWTLNENFEMHYFPDGENWTVVLKNARLMYHLI